MQEIYLGVYILETGIREQGRIKKKRRKKEMREKHDQTAASWASTTGSLDDAVVSSDTVVSQNFLQLPLSLSVLCNTVAMRYKCLLITQNVDRTEELNIFNSSN